MTIDDITIDDITNLFKLKSAEDGYWGFLYPSGRPWSYGRACLKLVMRVRPVPNDLFGFSAHILSVDDSGLSIYGPDESEDKAKERLVKFKDFIESWQYACPTPDVMEYECQRIGIFPEYW